MATFAERLFDELSAAEAGPDFELLCEGIGAMFQPVEDIAGDDEETGAPGFSSLLDINRAETDALGFLAQFIGARLLPNVSEADQRAWIESGAGFARGRPGAIKSTAMATLTGDKVVILRERDGSAWRYTVITKPSETPDATHTQQVLQSQKPGPDIMTHVQSDYIDYEWLKENEADYSALDADFATYDDIKNREF